MSEEKTQVKVSSNTGCAMLTIFVILLFLLFSGVRLVFERDGKATEYKVEMWNK